MFAKIFNAVAILILVAASIFTMPSGAAADTVEVKIENLKFTIKPGDTVHWTWTTTGHSTTSGAGCTQNNNWDSGVLGVGSEFSHTFNTVGDYPYFCQPHCQFGMKGKVKVAESTPTGPPVTLDNPIPQAITKGNISPRLILVASGLTAPNLAIAAPGDKNRLFVIDQIGLIWVIDLKTGNKSKFGDLSSLLVPLGISGPGSYDERGLLGLAFHPRYRSNGLLYTFTSEPVQNNADFSTQPIGIAPNHQSVIREWHALYCNGRWRKCRRPGRWT